MISKIYTQGSTKAPKVRTSLIVWAKPTGKTGLVKKADARG